MEKIKIFVKHIYTKSKPWSLCMRVCADTGRGRGGSSGDGGHGDDEYDVVGRTRVTGRQSIVDARRIDTRADTAARRLHRPRHHHYRQLLHDDGRRHQPVDVIRWVPYIHMPHN